VGAGGAGCQAPGGGEGGGGAVGGAAGQLGAWPCRITVGSSVDPPPGGHGGTVIASAPFQNALQYTSLRRFSGHNM